MSQASSPRSRMQNRKLANSAKFFSLVCILGNSNIGIKICHCNIESAFVWKCTRSHTWLLHCAKLGQEWLWSVFIKCLVSGHPWPYFNDQPTIWKRKSYNIYTRLYIRFMLFKYQGFSDSNFTDIHCRIRNKIEFLYRGFRMLLRENSKSWDAVEWFVILHHYHHKSQH